MKEAKETFITNTTNTDNKLEMIAVTPAMKAVVKCINCIDDTGDCYDSLLFLLRNTLRQYDHMRDLEEKASQEFYIAFELLRVFEQLRREKLNAYGY